MSIKYSNLIQRKRSFLRLSGITQDQFDQIIKRITPLWQREVLGKYKRPGRNFSLSLNDMVLMLLVYYRSYASQAFIGLMFGIDDSRVCRIIRKLEPLLAKITAIPKKKYLTESEIEDALVIDATEQQIQRPHKKQKSYYSGKKKKHTIKTEIRTTINGEITYVSKSYPGAMHDMKVHGQSPPVHPETETLVDLGYQGLAKRHSKTHLPYKKKKGSSLTQSEKQHNRSLSQMRIIVENIIGDLKTFRILSERYRNKMKRYNLKFKIIAGLVNIKNGFAMI